jgi:hypothetical protein
MRGGGGGWSSDEWARAKGIPAKAAAVVRRIVNSHGESVFTQHFATMPNRSEARAPQTIGRLAVGYHGTLGLPARRKRLFSIPTAAPGASRSTSPGRAARMSEMAYDYYRTLHIFDHKGLVEASRRARLDH